MKLGRKAALTLTGVCIISVYGIILSVTKQIDVAMLGVIVGGITGLITQYTAGNVRQRRNGTSDHPENNIT